MSNTDGFTFAPTPCPNAKAYLVAQDGITVGMVRKAGPGFTGWLAYTHEDTADGPAFARLPGAFAYGSRLIAARSITAHMTPDFS